MERILPWALGVKGGIPRQERQHLKAGTERGCVWRNRLTS